MKSIFFLLTIAVGSSSLATDACFNDPSIQKLIQESSEIDECFDRDNSQCAKLIPKMSIKDQRELNSQRLVPVDRSRNQLMNVATGTVAFFRGSEVVAASGAKISRCHVITSAHLLYGNPSIYASPEDFPSTKEQDDLKLAFYSGQTCDARLFSSKVGARLTFKMTREGVDFVCDKKDTKGICIERRFNGRSDLVILRLDDYSKLDNNYFRLRQDPKNIPESGFLVNCWGYPEYNQYIKLDKNLSNQVLWYQKNARIFPWQYDRGLVTNATAYPGMSGGGCVDSMDQQQLLGVFADKNSVSGHAAILISETTVDKHAANFLSSFFQLASRYKAATGKDIQRLDEECS
jgi:hypothetical protein